MTTIYVVTSGSYSDYGIETVFSTRELAELYIAASGRRDDPEGDGPHIEEYALDSNERQLREGLKFYRVYMRRDGSSVIESELPNDPSSFELAPSRIYPYQTYDRFERRHLPANTFRPAYIFGSVWALSEQHAAKIANEKRAQLIASGEWPEE